MTLPLLPNTDFGSVSLWTTDLAYLAFNQVRDGLTQYLGHHALITDAELDTGSGSILARVAAVTNPFLVSQVGTTGSVVTWQSGQFRSPAGVVSTIASAQLSLPADSTNYIYINSSGTVTYSTGSSDAVAFAGIPVVRHILAKVVVVSTNISAITDLRAISIRGASPPASVIRTFGGQSSTDITVTAGQVLTGTIYCRNFTVPAGISCTITYYTRIVCSGAFTNNGTITVTKLPYGAPSLPTYLSKTGGTAGSLPGTGFVTRGSKYDPTFQNVSSGGSQGSSILPNESGVTNGYVTLGAGGDAGGSFIVEAYGTITQNGIILADGGNAAANTSSYQAADLSVTNGKCISSGSGGGAGGLVSFTSLTGITCTGSSITSVKGGNGGDALIVSAAASPYMALGGYGGGGGYISLNTPGTLATTGATFTMTGGVSGAHANYSSALITVSPGSYKILNTTFGILTAGYGAGYGGIGGYMFAQSNDATYSYFSIAPGSSGQLLTNTYLPLA